MQLKLQSGKCLITKTSEKKNPMVGLGGMPLLGIYIYIWYNITMLTGLNSQIVLDPMMVLAPESPFAGAHAAAGFASILGGPSST